MEASEGIPFTWRTAVLVLEGPGVGFDKSSSAQLLRESVEGIGEVTGKVG